MENNTKRKADQIIGRIASANNTSPEAMRSQLRDGTALSSGAEARSVTKAPK